MVHNFILKYLVICCTFLTEVAGVVGPDSAPQKMKLLPKFRYIMGVSFRKSGGPEKGDQDLKN